jgi:hypothetical protein
MGHVASALSREERSWPVGKWRSEASGDGGREGGWGGEESGKGISEWGGGGERRRRRRRKKKKKKKSENSVFSCLRHHSILSQFILPSSRKAALKHHISMWGVLQGQALKKRGEWQVIGNRIFGMLGTRREMPCGERQERKPAGDTPLVPSVPLPRWYQSPKIYGLHKRSA